MVYLELCTCFLLDWDRSGMAGKQDRLAGRKSKQESQTDKGKADKTEGKEWTMGEQTGRGSCKELKPWLKAREKTKTIDLSVSLSWLCSSSIHWKASSSMLRSWASWLLIWREKCLGSRDASWCTLSSVHCEGWVRGITMESVGPRLPQEYKSSWNPGQAELSLLKIRSSRKAKNLIREGQRQPLEPFITL